MINIGFSNDFHYSLQRPKLLKLFSDYLQNTSNTKEQKLLMHFFSNLTFFKKLRILILEQKLDSIFEIQFRDPVLANMIKQHSKTPSQNYERNIPIHLEKTHYELIGSPKKVKLKPRKQCTYEKKISVNAVHHEHIKFCKSEFPKHSPLFLVTENGFLMSTKLLPKNEIVNSNFNKMHKNYVQLEPEIIKSEISLAFLSNIALANLTLDFNSFNYYHGELNMVTSLFVYDYLNPFGKMKIFENILNFLLHKKHLKIIKPDGNYFLFHY